jgi:hypothetical protein
MFSKKGKIYTSVRALSFVCLLEKKENAMLAPDNLWTTILVLLKTCNFADLYGHLVRMFLKTSKKYI